MKGKIFLGIFRVASCFLVVIAMVLLGFWHYENLKSKEVASYLLEVSSPTGVYSENDIPYININFKELKSESNDAVGWIRVLGTNIDYAVVQAADNDYYLNRNFYKEVSQVGWVFMDYRNDPYMLNKNTTIYAHNRLDGSMFGSLDNLLKELWHQKNKYIMFNLEGMVMTWEVYSVYMIDKLDYDSRVNFSSDIEFMDYVNKTKENSLMNFDVEVGPKDNILTLYTCDESNNNRLIVHAKLVFTK